MADLTNEQRLDNEIQRLIQSLESIDIFADGGANQYERILSMIYTLQDMRRIMEEDNG